MPKANKQFDLIYELHSEFSQEGNRTMKLRFLYTALFAMGSLLATTLAAQEPAVSSTVYLDELRLSDDSALISGEAGASEGPLVQFSADYAVPNVVTVVFTTADRELSVVVDSAAKRATFFGRSLQSGRAATMRDFDRIWLKEVVHLFQTKYEAIDKFSSETSRDALITLLKVVELLSAIEVGRDLDFEVSAPQNRAWTSLCSQLGRSRQAFWDNDVQTRFKNFIVGGHGVCKGRCGAGCPWFADPAYTQDCLNHDACAGEEGQQLGVCSDEWNAAADDFLFAPDC